MNALVDSPEEAVDLKMRSNLMSCIAYEIRSWGLTQRKAATRTGVSAPRINDLLQGKIDRLSLSTLIKIAVRIGLTLDLRVYKIDRTPV